MAGIQTDDVNAELRSFTVGIAANESESGVIDLKAHRMSCFMVDGWTAADATILVSLDGTNFYPLRNTSGEYKVASAAMVANQVIGVDLALLFGFRYIKIRSGVFGAPVNQTATRSVTVGAVPR